MRRGRLASNFFSKRRGKKIYVEREEREYVYIKLRSLSKSGGNRYKKTDRGEERERESEKE